ncbi:MAG: alpha/beta fold hydrolase [Desulfobacterales bacterium]
MKEDFSALDRPEVVRFLFHPRRDPGGPSPATDPPSIPGLVEVLLPVDDGVEVGARFHLGARCYPNILLFHGNGEIAADYDELGPIYHRLGINFLVFDYRGYGRSSGGPTATAMMRDSHVLFARAEQWLRYRSFSGPLIVMGRSLGSASAIELADTYPDRIAALIVESGFAFASPLLRRLGIDPAAIGFEEETAFRHIEKIGRWQKPLLVIHAEHDHIIPFADGRALYEASPAACKRLLAIPGADHNTILAVGFAAYFEAIAEFAAAVVHHSSP